MAVVTICSDFGAKENKICYFFHCEWVSEIAQSCPTLWDPMDCSLPGFSVHGILQARILEWVTISFSRGSSRSRDQTRVFCIEGRRFNLWATREAIPIYLPWLMNLAAMIFVFFECWVLSWLFHSPFSLSSRNSLVSLHFLP